jgi:hypothetical protein
MSDLEKLYNGFSDDFKDIYGFRPRFAMSEDEILQWYDLHIDWHKNQAEYGAWIDAVESDDFSAVRYLFEELLTIEVDDLVNLGEVLEGVA